MLVGFFLVFKCETTIANMIEVFEPLKERYSHTTSITVEVWNYQHIVFLEYLLSLSSGWTVSSLGNYLCLYLKLLRKNELVKHSSLKITQTSR